MSKSKNTFDILPPHKTLELDPAVIQAVWRCMLGGNDHWVTYRCTRPDQPQQRHQRPEMVHRTHRQEAESTADDTPGSRTTSQPKQ